MAIEIRRFTVTTPAGVAQAAPQTTALHIPPRRVDRVDVRVPPGPAGNLGFQLWLGGGQVIPFDMGAWIATDNEPLQFDLTDFPESGAWSLLSYNTGTYSHSLWVALHCQLPTPPPTTPLQPLPVMAISPLGGPA